MQNEIITKQLEYVNNQISLLDNIFDIDDFNIKYFKTMIRVEVFGHFKSMELLYKYYLANENKIGNWLIHINFMYTDPDLALQNDVELLLLYNIEEREGM